MGYQVIIPKGSAPPLAPYSPGTKAGNAVYVSGTLALDSEGKLVGAGDPKAQTRHILESIKSVLAAAGGSLRDITFNHIFLSDMKYYAAMNEVYREYFPKGQPARYCIQSPLVKPEFLVEIASIAHLDAPRAVKKAGAKKGVKKAAKKSAAKKKAGRRR